jgi:hypothetical protein
MGHFSDKLEEDVTGLNFARRDLFNLVTSPSRPANLHQMVQLVSESDHQKHP